MTCRSPYKDSKGGPRNWSFLQLETIKTLKKKCVTNYLIHILKINI